MAKLKKKAKRNILLIFLLVFMLLGFFGYKFIFKNENFDNNNNNKITEKKKEEDPIKTYTAKLIAITHKAKMLTINIFLKLKFIFSPILKIYKQIISCILYFFKYFFRFPLFFRRINRSFLLTITAFWCIIILLYL